MTRANEGGTRVRRDYGEGSIFYEESRARYVGLLSLPKKDGKAQPRRKFTGKTRQEVVRKLREAKRDLEDGRAVAKARDTLGDLLKEWQQRDYPLTRARTGNTKAGYDWALAHLMDERTGIAGVKLRELTADDIEGFLSGKIKPSGNGRPLGHRSIVQILRVLRTALQWGKRSGKVRANVADDVLVPEDGGRRPSKAFKPEEVTALLSAAADADQEAMQHSGSSGRATRLEAAWYVMALMGLRPGECFALRWSDIDEKSDGGILTVSGSLVRDQKTNTLKIGPTKTAKSRSRMDIPEPVLDALRAHRKWQMSTGIGTDLVFSNETGGLLDPSAVRRRFKKLCAKAGVGDAEKRHPHELRHSCATILEYIYGLPAPQVADVLRHTDVHTYLRVYRHSEIRPSVGGALGMAALAPVRELPGA
ncbi:site-specific integrase [Pseudonocardia kunmingensis]|uniref:Site-specific recombinase XerD n=1 Tax=Pseudonocardia kunmingensis TaxID=630975 RepID=A0A543DAR9_9PSEU|nr:site-specific integrase [Pseudonocardia kunmingensis]TQM06439.1 site-specific recombinase XerD [Pseudonocardia kunmingensis]